MLLILASGLGLPQTQTLIIRVKSTGIGLDMDIKKTKPSPKGLSRNQLFLLLAVVLVALVIIAYQRGSDVSVSHEDILLADVQRGDVDITVNGFGILKSNKRQLITAQSPAIVKEIILKAGAIVESGSVIVELENPDINQLVENAQQELSKAKANYRKLLLNNQRELLTEQAAIADTKTQLEAATLKRAARETLVKDGVVSKLDFIESQLLERQLENQLKITTQRMEQLLKVHAEALNIQQEESNLYKTNLITAQKKLDDLSIKAAFSGVLQRMDLELGQSIGAGSEVALIGSTDDLIALINVAQSSAQQLNLKQKVLIDTYQQVITGHIVRINPVVFENTVEIEVVFDTEQPANVRPEQSISAEVIIESLTNILYVQRPAKVKAKSKQFVYKLKQNKSEAELSAIRFGKLANRSIEIVDGAQAGDTLIISDLSDLDATHISIN
jgi:biotin carboxyl carrier protein